MLPCEDSSPDSAELIIGTIRDLCHAVNALIGCIADQNCQQVIFMGTASGLGTQHMSEAVNETGVTINHAQYIRNPRCGNLLEEGIVDQMMFAGRRQAPEAFTLRITQDDIPVVFLFKIFADFVQTGIQFHGHLFDQLFRLLR